MLVYLLYTFCCTIALHKSRGLVANEENAYPLYEGSEALEVVSVSRFV